MNRKARSRCEEERRSNQARTCREKPDGESSSRNAHTFLPLCSELSHRHSFHERRQLAKLLPTLCQKVRQPPMNASDIIFYTTPQGEVRIEVYFEDETFWLTQKKMAELFDVKVNTINYHLQEINKSAELQEEATIRRIRIVQMEGGRDVARESGALQPRHDHRGRLPDEQRSCHQVPDLSQQHTERVHHQRLRSGRCAAEAGQAFRAGLLRATAGADKRDPCERTAILPEDRGHLRALRRFTTRTMSAPATSSPERISRPLSVASEEDFVTRRGAKPAHSWTLCKG